MAYRVTYHVALTYHPDVGTFRGKRGAWRVHHWAAHCLPDAPELFAGEDLDRNKVLVVPSLKPYRRGTWANPFKILKQYQSTKRSNTQ